jgi:hypothetical protein
MLGMDDFGFPPPEEDQAVGRDSAGRPVTPTRPRGTATGFIDSMMVSEYLLGAAIWTGFVQ